MIREQITHADEVLTTFTPPPEAPPSHAFIMVIGFQHMNFQGTEAFMTLQSVMIRIRTGNIGSFASLHEIT